MTECLLEFLVDLLLQARDASRLQRSWANLVDMYRHDSQVVLSNLVELTVF